MPLHTLMLLPMVALLAGCATVMPASPQAIGLVEGRLQMDTRPRVVDRNKLPLRFVQHKFDVHVYDTLAFYVEYNGTGWFSDQYRTARSPSYADSIPRERWPLAAGRLYRCTQLARPGEAALDITGRCPAHGGH